MVLKTQVPPPTSPQLAGRQNDDAARRRNTQQRLCPSARSIVHEPIRGGALGNVAVDWSRRAGAVHVASVAPRGRLPSEQKTVDYVLSESLRDAAAGLSSAASRPSRNTYTSSRHAGPIPREGAEIAKRHLSWFRARPVPSPLVGDTSRTPPALPDAGDAHACLTVPTTRQGCLWSYFHALDHGAVGMYAISVSVRRCRRCD